MQDAIHSEKISAFDASAYAVTGTTKSSLVTRFINWCKTQEDNRFLWLGISLFGHIGMIVPLTLLAIIYFADNNFTLWLITCAVNVPILALNLAAQPPKVTLPTLFIAVIADLGIIATCTAMFFS
jgi:hypothetical protein